MPRAKNPTADATHLDTWGRRNRKNADKICPECGAVFRPHRASSRFCSRPCMWANNGGRNAKPETWWTNAKGYIEGRIWIDGKQHQVKRHRLIAATMLGRPLRADEDVHHINGDKADNRPENLMVLPRGEHSRITNYARWSAKASGEPRS